MHSVIFLLLLSDHDNWLSRHCYQLYISGDGHFGLHLKDNKKDDPDDISLLADRAFFPLDAPYNHYLSIVGESKEVC